MFLTVTHPPCCKTQAQIKIFPVSLNGGCNSAGAAESGGALGDSETGSAKCVVYKTFSSSQTKTLYSLNNPPPPYPSPPGNHHSPVCFYESDHSVPHVSGITQYLSFRVCLGHFAKCPQTSSILEPVSEFPSLRLNTFHYLHGPHLVYPFTHDGHLGYFHLSATVNSRDVNTGRQYLFESQVSTLLNTHLGVELLGRMVILCGVFEFGVSVFYSTTTKKGYIQPLTYMSPIM